jgi:general secretion pathway protein G
MQTQRRTARRRARRGFTLIEVLLVLAILGVIAAMVVPNILGRQEEAYIKTARQSIRGVESAAETFRVDHDAEWPQDITQMVEPEVVNGQQKEPYLTKIPVDPWGNPIQYEYQSGQLKPRVWSWGPDKKDGGGDDISNQDVDENNQPL